MLARTLSPLQLPSHGRPLTGREDSVKRCRHLHKHGFFHSTGIKDFPSGLLRPHRGALMQGSGAFRVKPSSNSPSNTPIPSKIYTTKMICEPKHLTTSFCFSPQRVVKQPFFFFSCTIGLSLRYKFFFFCNILSCQIKKIYYGSLFVFVFFFLFISKFTNKKVH